MMKNLNSLFGLVLLTLFGIPATLAQQAQSKTPPLANNAALNEAKLERLFYTPGQRQFIDRKRLGNTQDDLANSEPITPTPDKVLTKPKPPAPRARGVIVRQGQVIHRW